MNDESYINDEEHRYPFDGSSVVEETASETDWSKAERNDVLIFWLLITLIVVLSVILLGMFIPEIYRFIKRRWPQDPKLIEKRYETIESWLISKRVVSHSSLCEECVTSSTTTRIQKDAELTLIQKSPSHDTAETTDDIYDEQDEHECPICMEVFQVGQVVSWSPILHKANDDKDESSCTHVFHHTCIKEWLLRNHTCPFCRNIYMHIDAHDIAVPRADLIRYSQERARKQQLSFFCVKDGFVQCKRQNKLKKEDVGAVSREELAQMRETPMECEVVSVTCDGSPSSNTEERTLIGGTSSPPPPATAVTSLQLFDDEEEIGDGSLGGIFRPRAHSDESELLNDMEEERIIVCKPSMSSEEE